MNHGLNMIILSMIEMTSIPRAAGSLNHYQTKHIQNGGWMEREGECPPPSPLQKKVELLWGQMSR